MKRLMKTLACISLAVALAFGLTASTLADVVASSPTQLVAKTTRKRRPKRKKRKPKRQPPKTYYVEGQQKIPYTSKFEFEKSAIRTPFAPLGEEKVRIRLTDIRHEKDITETVHVQLYYRDLYNKHWVKGAHTSLKVTAERQQAAYILNIPSNRPFYVKLYKKNHHDVETKGKLEIMHADSE